MRTNKASIKQILAKQERLEELVLQQEKSIEKLLAMQNILIVNSLLDDISGLQGNMNKSNKKQIDNIKITLMEDMAEKTIVALGGKDNIKLCYSNTSHLKVKVKNMKLVSVIELEQLGLKVDKINQYLLSLYFKELFACFNLQLLKLINE